MGEVSYTTWCFLNYFVLTPLGTTTSHFSIPFLQSTAALIAVNHFCPILLLLDDDNIKFLLVDGCNTERVDDILWPELAIGQDVQLPCPCEDVLQSGQMASRACGGTYTQGGQWEDVNYNQCDSVTKEVTNRLCSLAMQVSIIIL